MYKCMVNKHACPTDATLQSVYEVQSSDLFTIYHNSLNAITPINSASLTAELCYSEFAH